MKLHSRYYAWYDYAKLDDKKGLSYISRFINLITKNFVVKNFNSHFSLIIGSMIRSHLVTPSYASRQDSWSNLWISDTNLVLFHSLPTYSVWRCQRYEHFLLLSDFRVYSLNPGTDLILGDASV